MRYGSKDESRSADLPAFSRMLRVASQNATTDRERMIAKNMPMVLFVARKYMRSKRDGQPITDDVLQVGMAGLVRAAEGFDASRGFQFGTYAFWSIWRSINREFETEDRAINLIPRNEDGECLKEQTVEDPLYRHQDIEEALATTKRALHGMDKRMKQMVLMRYCREMRLHEIGSEFGVSTERVRVVVERGLREARQTLHRREKRRKRIVRERAMTMA